MRGCCGGGGGGGHAVGQQQQQEQQRKKSGVCSDRLLLRNWTGFFVLGTINNLAYVVINSAAQSLAISFDKRNLLGLIPWANVAAGFLLRGLNTFVLEPIAVKWRMLANTLLLAGGLVGLALSVFVSFEFALAMIVVVGSASSFGESILLGYQRKYPPSVVGGWSSGTGLAGVGGSLLYVLLSAVIGLTNEYTFFVLVPTAVLYMLTYALWLKEPKAKVEPEGEAHTAAPHATVDDVGIQAETAPLLGHAEPVHLETKPGGGVEEPIIHDVLVPPLESRCQRYLRCLKLCWWISLNLGGVYFFEYVISTGAADRAEPDGFEQSTDWFVRNSYVILAFCYQLGVLISRSSLQFFPIKRIGILTLIQAANFALWICQAKFKFMPIWVQFIAMLFVGLLGGSSYVNSFSLLLKSQDIPDRDRELVVNMAALSINIGIVLASAFTIIMDNTFLPLPPSTTTVAMLTSVLSTTAPALTTS